MGRPRLEDLQVTEGQEKETDSQVAKLEKQVAELLSEIGKVKNSTKASASVLEALTAIIDASDDMQATLKRRTRRKVVAEIIEPFKESYHEVIFSFARPGESRDVHVGVQGTILNIKRGIKVILPKSVLNVLDDSTVIYNIPTFDPKTGQSSSEQRIIPTYSYNVTGRAVTAADFQAMLRKGNKIQLESKKQMELIKGNFDQDEDE